MLSICSRRLVLLEMLWTLEKFQASEISPLPVFLSVFPSALVQAYDLVWGTQTALAKLSESATVSGTVLAWGRVLALGIGGASASVVELREASASERQVPNLPEKRWAEVPSALGVLAQAALAEVALKPPALVRVEMAPAVFPPPEDRFRSNPRSEEASAPDFPPMRFPPFPDCRRTSLD
jgi:hypothetical protein